MKHFLTAGLTIAAILLWNATSSANLVVNGGFERVQSPLCQRFQPISDIFRG